MKTNELISKRESLISDIKKNWERIYAFNQVDKSKSHYNVDALMKTIISDSIKLVGIKVAIQAANMGLKKIEDLPEDCIYPTIFALQQLKEQKVKLLGLKKYTTNGVISKKKIDGDLQEINVEIDKLSEMIDNFNKDTDFKFEE
jgi:hypothetical protein